MNKTQEALHKINILINQMAQSIDSGEKSFVWVEDRTDEIEGIINEI